MKKLLHDVADSWVAGTFYDLPRHLLKESGFSLRVNEGGRIGLTAKHFNLVAE